jgi:signal transduction histidine kinase
LLHYSREAKLEDQEVSLAAMATDAAELLTHHLERSGMQLVMELGPCAPVRGNENELHQVFSNLVLNSRDALLQGDYPKEIRVRLWQEGNEARLAVMDRGPGIPDEVLPHIFEPFFTTRPMGGEGAGLGLSVSQQIVSKHQGRLAVSTRPGETVFTLILPTI